MYEEFLFRHKEKETAHLTPVNHVTEKLKSSPQQTEVFDSKTDRGEITMSESSVLLNKHEVERLLSYDDLIPRLESVMGKFSKRDSSEIIQPVRSVVPIQQHNGYE